jgi:hypothetical protein
MPADGEDLGPSGSEYEEFVPVVYARSEDDAEKYRQLLEDHDIPALIDDESEDEDEQQKGKAKRRRGLRHGVPILVPEAMLDEASEVIADREDFDEFAPSDEAEEEEDEDDGEFGYSEEAGDLEDSLEEESLFDDDLDETEDGPDSDDL